MQVKGYNGTINFDGVFVTITRAGFRARVSVGKGEKRIPVSQLSAVQFKKSGWGVDASVGTNTDLVMPACKASTPAVAVLVMGLSFLASEDIRG